MSPSTLERVWAGAVTVSESAMTAEKKRGEEEISPQSQDMQSLFAMSGQFRITHFRKVLSEHPKLQPLYKKILCNLVTVSCGGFMIKQTIMMLTVMGVKINKHPAVSCVQNLIYFSEKVLMEVTALYFLFQT